MSIPFHRYQQGLCPPHTVYQWYNTPVWVFPMLYTKHVIQYISGKSRIFIRTHLLVILLQAFMQNIIALWLLVATLPVGYLICIFLCARFGSGSVFLELKTFLTPFFQPILLHQHKAVFYHYRYGKSYILSAIQYKIFQFPGNCILRLACHYISNVLQPLANICLFTYFLRSIRSGKGNSFPPLPHHIYLCISGFFCRIPSYLSGIIFCSSPSILLGKYIMLPIRPYYFSPWVISPIRCFRLA